MVGFQGAEWNGLCGMSCGSPEATSLASLGHFLCSLCSILGFSHSHFTTSTVLTPQNSNWDVTCKDTPLKGRPAPYTYIANTIQYFCAAWILLVACLILPSFSSNKPRNNNLINLLETFRDLFFLIYKSHVLNENVEMYIYYAGIYISYFHDQEIVQGGVHWTFSLESKIDCIVRDCFFQMIIGVVEGVCVLMNDVDAHGGPWE